jgi:hypothetical protein
MAQCFTSSVCFLQKVHKLKLIIIKHKLESELFFITVTCVALDLAFPTFKTAA